MNPPAALRPAPPAHEPATAQAPAAVPVPAVVAAPEPARAPRAQAAAPAFRADIEGLRGVAVALVVLFHAGVPGFGGGFVGVDVFFVLSGYLITTLLLREVERTGRVDFAGFYARRIRRLLPASVLMLVATAAAAVLVLSPLERFRFGSSALATALYSSNLWFTRAFDYFSPGAESNPLLHTWSLAVEEQFYLVWPVLVLLAGRRSRKTLAVVLAAASVVSLAACAWLTSVRPGYAFFLMPPRAWEFGLGGLAALVPAAVASRRVKPAAGWIAAAGIVAAATLFSAATPFPGWAALLPVAATAGVLVAGAGERPRAVGVLFHPVLQHLGRLSYSWYLWHWPFLVFGAVLLPRAPLAGRLALALASLAVAELAFRLVETPVRQSRVLAARPKLTLAIGAGLTAVAVCAALLWRWEAGRAVRTPAQATILAATSDRGRVYQAPCVTGLSHPEVKECAFGDTASAVTVALVGDSHAAQWVEAMDRAARLRGWRLVTYLKSGCPAVTVPVFNPKLRKVEGECGAWRGAVLRRLAGTRPRAVVLASWSAYVAGSGDPSGYSTVPAERWREGLAGMVRAARASGATVVLLHDTPNPGTDVPTCLSRGASCDVSRAAAFNPAAAAAELDAARGEGAAVVDLTDRFCRGATCPAAAEGTVRFYDESHVTARYMQTLAAPLAQQLAPLVEGTSLPAAPAPTREARP